MSPHVNLNTILPVEVLTRIIVDCIVDDPAFTSPHYRAARIDLPDVALSVSHVCQRWRGIALSSGGKRLWTHAPLRRKEACVEVFMKRSHPLPVFFKIEATMKEGELPISSSLPALETALKESSRVKAMAVDFDIGNDSSSDEVYDYWVIEKYQKMTRLLDRHSFPALEYLSWTTWITSTGHTFSLNLFNGEVPRSLRRLHLHNAEFTQQIPVLRAPLTSLVLHQCKCWHRIDDFISTLLNMPSLETLAISSEGLYHCALRTSSRSTQHQRRSIPLSHLARLALDETLDVVPLLFAYIRVPISCRIHMELALKNHVPPRPDQYWEHWDSLQIALRAHFDSCSFDRLVVSGTGDEDSHFLLCASSATGLPTFDLHFHSPYEEFNREEMRLLRTLRNLLTLPFLSRASTIVARDIAVFSPILYETHDLYDGRSVASPFSAARTVIATRSAVDGMVHSLIRDTHQPLLPELQSIELREVVLCTNDPHIIQPIFTALIGAIVAREHLGTVQAVRTIELRSCEVTEKTVDILVDAVNADVFWDERCLSSSELAAMIERRRFDPEHEGIMGQIIDEAELPW